MLIIITFFASWEKEHGTDGVLSKDISKTK